LKNKNALIFADKSTDCLGPGGGPAGLIRKLVPTYFKYHLIVLPADSNTIREIEKLQGLSALPSNQ
jgi:hypothetical protein